MASRQATSSGGPQTPELDEKDSANNTAEEELEKAPEYDIDPENEVTGVKLLIVHTGICLCTFLVGLVSNNPRHYLCTHYKCLNC